MITPQNILRHELTGLQVRVCDSTHGGYECSGTIHSESRNTIEIDTGAGIKTVPKDCVTLEVKLPGGQMVRIEGSLLISRPEDRIKKKYRIKFV